MFRAASATSTDVDEVKLLRFTREIEMPNSVDRLTEFGFAGSVGFQVKRTNSPAFVALYKGRMPAAPLRKLGKSREARYSEKSRNPTGSTGALALNSRQR